MILVTGGTGLLGAHLLLELLSRNEKVRAIYRTIESIEKTKQIFSFYDNSKNIDINKIEWLNADVTDISSLSYAFKEVKKVYHCAAMVSLVPKDREAIFNTNIRGTANIVNLSLENKIDSLCHVSSIASISKQNNNNEIVEQNEFDATENNSNYAYSKYISELEVWRGIAEGLNAVIVNPSVILGPGDWKNGTGKIINKIYNGLPFYSDGTIGFIDVRDVCKIMIFLIEKNIYYQRFILSENNYSFKEVFSKIAMANNKKAPGIRVNPFIFSIAWRIEALKSMFTGTKPVITKESVSSLVSKSMYSNKKIRETVKIDFIPIDQSIKHITSCYLKSL